METVAKLARLWNTASGEDRQGLAQTLFDYIAYDLDTRRIVDFRLKPWADRFLVLRSALYEDTPKTPNGTNGDGGHNDEIITQLTQPDSEAMTVFGLENSVGALIIFYLM